MSHTLNATLMISLFSLFAVGCASTEVSQQEYAEPRETLAAAQQAVPEGDSQATIYIQYAKENLEVADKLIDEKKFDRARFYLDRAQADAQLALAYSKRDTTRNQLKEIEGRIDTLRAESI